MRFQTSVILTIVCLLLSNSIIAQKKWPEPKTDTYKISQFNPSGDGYILSNLNFTSKVTLVQPEREKYAWDAKVLFKSCNVDGYVYDGVTYSKTQLVNDFGISSLTFTTITLKSVRIDFDNREGFRVNYLAMGNSIGAYGQLSYNKYEEMHDFKLFEIAIHGDLRDSFLEGKIKRGLAKKEKEDKNSNTKKGGAGSTAVSGSNTDSGSNTASESNDDLESSDKSKSSDESKSSDKSESSDASESNQESKEEYVEEPKRDRAAEYRNRIENQNRENRAVASAAAVSSVGALYMLGGFLYANMGSPANDLYTGSNFHVNFDVGYGFSYFPIAFDSSVGIEDRNATTIDLRLALKFGYEMEYGGGNIYGRFEPGFSPIFTDFNTSYGYGAEFFGGSKIIKLYGRYEIGAHNFTSNNWLDSEEEGKGGKSSTAYQQIRAGLKFSYYRNSRTAKRDHLIIGIIENYFDKDSAPRFSNRETLDESLLNIIKVDDPRYIATGYFFEWKRDHTHRLYIELFPNYPVTGEIGNTGPNEGKFFIQAGFSRSIESFFGNN